MSASSTAQANPRSQPPSSVSGHFRKSHCRIYTFSSAIVFPSNSNPSSFAVNCNHIVTHVTPNTPSFILPSFPSSSTAKIHSQREKRNTHASHRPPPHPPSSLLSSLLSYGSLFLACASCILAVKGGGSCLPLPALILLGVPVRGREEEDDAPDGFMPCWLAGC